MSELANAYRSNVVKLDESDAEKLIAAYRFRRTIQRDSMNRNRVTYRVDGERGFAEIALSLARLDVANGTRRYASSPWRKPLTNPLTEERAMWIESPSSVGLRFVGYADELCRSINHTGWHTNGHGDSIRGVVYQLPGRDGKARFVAGHDNADNGAADSDGPAYVDFSQIIESDFVAEMHSALRSMGKSYHTPERLKPGYWAEAAHETARTEAARAADEFTRVHAEEEREYNTAWQAGNLWRDTVDEIKSEREEVAKLLKERKAARANADTFPTICATIRAAIVSSLSSIQELRDKRDTLASGDYESRHSYYGFWTGDPKLRAAFNDGAGETVL